jgi:NLI interacting factor-like phosphatase
MRRTAILIPCCQLPCLALPCTLSWKKSVADAVFGGREHHVSVRRRPHLAAFLDRVAALFEVVVFTASQKVDTRRCLQAARHAPEQLMATR